MSKRARIHIPQHPGERIADAVASKVGSWSFILIQSAILAAWIIFNSVVGFYHWDPAPYILLNLLLSFQAAFTGPFVMMSQNRQAEKDRNRDDLESEEVQQIYDGHQLLLQINQQQLEILQLLQGKRGATK